VHALANELWDSKSAGRSLIVAGGRVSPQVHSMIAALNDALGNVGKTVEYYAEPEDPRAEAGWTPHSKQIELFAKAAAGAEAVLVIGCNPVYTGPADLKIAEVLGKAKVSIHLGTHEDETARACDWHVPQAHYLEAWGDVRTFDGTVSIAQPLIEPLFDGKSTIELLSLLAGEGKAGYEIVREVAKADYLAGRFTEWNWKKSLFDGVVAESARKPETVSVRRDLVLHQLRVVNGMELVFVTGNVFDGRFANNGWLQELPDPMTRVTWDNTLLLSPKDAERLGVSSDDVVKVTVGAKREQNDVTLMVPTDDTSVGVSIDDATVFVLPGQPEGVAGLALGYGRTAAGSIGNGVGSNAYALRTTAAYDYATGLTIAKSGRVNYLATVQDHHVIDPVGANRKRELVPELVVEGTFAEYVKKPQLGTRRVVSLSMFDEKDYSKGHKWGLAIDLTTCTGCSACVVACQAENNVPIVGKEQVIHGREMHWLRIDRYFKHEKDNPQAVHQPVMCMHCENAPCEEVCPVAATTHSAEGLNMMTYNRCIGTRYCSNNCPYKVRRFNFFDFNAGTKENLYRPNLLRPELDDLLRMQKNPQVTVRSRGVMEKCTYCVQRIENARIQLRAENRGKADESRIADGVVQTACQQSCPTSAIVFGDLNDPKSKVAQLHKQAQAYGMLDPELNTKPRTQYLAKVRHPVEGLDAALFSTEKSEGYFFEEQKGKTVDTEKGGEH
jgi:Fe-S-cluster-containing dehydrogenase component